MSYIDINGVELKEGMFVKVTGSKTKSENDVYVVAVDQNVNENYMKKDAYWLHKVKANGEESKTKYNLLNIYGENSDRYTKNLTIEVVTDLKKAKKAVKEFLNGVTAKEEVHQFNEVTDKKLEVGRLIKINKPVLLKGYLNKFIGTYEITDISDKFVNLHLIGKRGNKIKDNVNNSYGYIPIRLSFSFEMVNTLFNEYEAVVLERHTTTKGEIKADKETETKKESKEVKEEASKEETKTDIEESTKEVNEEQTLYTYAVKEDIDTRDNSKIYLVNVKEKLSKEEYVRVNKYIKSIGGYYSRFKHAFLFKDDPRKKLGLSLEVEKENKENNNINSDNEVAEDIKEVENNAEVKEQEEVINITFNKDMNTIEIRLENKTEETEAILKANGYTWLSFVKSYVIDDNYNNRKFLQDNFKQYLKEVM